MIVIPCLLVHRKELGMATLHGCDTWFSIRANFPQFLQLCFLINRLVYLVPELLHPELRTRGHHVWSLLTGSSVLALPGCGAPRLSVTALHFVALVVMEKVLAYLQLRVEARNSCRFR